MASKPVFNAQQFLADQGVQIVDQEGPALLVKTTDESGASKDMRINGDAVVKDSMQKMGLNPDEYDISYSSPETPLPSGTDFYTQFQLADARTPSEKERTLIKMYGKENVKAAMNAESGVDFVINDKGNWRKAESGLLAELMSRPEITAGGTAGAAIGTMVAPGIGTIVGSVIGAGVGTAAHMSRLYAAGIKDEETAGQVTTDIAKEMAITAAMGTVVPAWKLVGKPGANLFRAAIDKVKTMGYGASKVWGELVALGTFNRNPTMRDSVVNAMDDSDAVFQYVRKNLDFKDAERVSEDSIMALAQKRAGFNLNSIKPGTEMRNKAEIRIQNEVNRIVEEQTYRKNPLEREAGDVLETMFNDAKRNMETKYGKVMNSEEVKSATDRAVVDLTNIKTEFKDILTNKQVVDDMGNLIKDANIDKVTSLIRPGDRKGLKKVFDLIHTVSTATDETGGWEKALDMSKTYYKDAVELRRGIDNYLQIIGNSADEGFTTEARRILTTLRTKVNNAMHTGLQKTAPELADKVTKANLQYSAERELLGMIGESHRMNKSNAASTISAMFGDQGNDVLNKIASVSVLAHENLPKFSRTPIQNLRAIKSAKDITQMLSPFRAGVKLGSVVNNTASNMLSKPTVMTLSTMAKAGEWMNKLSKPQLAALSSQPVMWQGLISNINNGVVLQEQIEQQAVQEGIQGQ